MTRGDIATMLGTTELEYCYYSFPVDQAPPLPYLVYFFPDSNDFIADNTNFVDVRRLTIELYMDMYNIDFDTIALVEDTLKSNNIVYAESSDVITSDQLYRVTFESEVILNGNQQSEVRTEPGVLR